MVQAKCELPPHLRLFIAYRRNSILHDRDQSRAATAPTTFPAAAERSFKEGEEKDVYLCLCISKRPRKAGRPHRGQLSWARFGPKLKNLDHGHGGVLPLP